MLIIELEMNKDDVVYLYYAQKIMVGFIRICPCSKYPADMHNVSLRTFVECIFRSMFLKIEKKITIFVI